MLDFPLLACNRLRYLCILCGSLSLGVGPACAPHTADSLQGGIGAKIAREDLALELYEVLRQQLAARMTAIEAGLNPHTSEQARNQPLAQRLHLLGEANLLYGAPHHEWLASIYNPRLRRTGNEGAANSDPANNGTAETASSRDDRGVWTLNSHTDPTLRSQSCVNGESREQSGVRNVLVRADGEISRSYGVECRWHIPNPYAERVHRSRNCGGRRGERRNVEISERRKIALRAIRRRLDQLAFGVLGREHITDHLVLDETNPQAGDSVARWVKAKRCIPGLLSPQDFEAKFDLEERHTRNLKHFRAGPTEVENAAPTQVEEIFETHYWVVPFDKVPVTSKQATATKSGQQLRTKQSVEVSLTGFDAVIGARFYRVGNHTRVANYVLLLGDSYRGHFYQTHSAIAGNHVRRSKGRQAPRYAMPCVPDLGLQRFFVSPDDPHAAPWRDDPHAAL